MKYVICLQSTYLLKYEESLRIAFVYIGENSTKIAIESAFLEAERLNYEESYEVNYQYLFTVLLFTSLHAAYLMKTFLHLLNLQIKVIQNEYIHTQFIINFKDYEVFLGFKY